MKYYDLISFKKNVTSELPLICLILSQQEQEQKRALQAALNTTSIPLKTFCIETFSVKAFIQEVETVPCFDKRKILHVSGIDKFHADDIEAIQVYANKPNQWVSLFLTASTLSPQSKLLKLIEKNGVVLFSRKEKPWEYEKRVADWLVLEANEAGIALSLPEAQALIKVVGTDQARLKNELEKLICYVGKRGVITLRDIQKVVASVHQETLWQLGDAIFWRKRTHALKIGKTLIEEGVVLFSLIAHLRAQIQTGMHVLTAFWKGGEQAVTQAFPYLKGGLLNKKLQMLRNYGFDPLQNALVHLFEMELKAKNSATNPTLLLEILIARLTSTHDALSIPECAWCC